MESTHIHNKLLFDGFNDALDFFRPYDIRGEPYNWQKPLTQKINKTTIKNYKSVFQKAKEKVLLWASTHCGVF